jgi:uncharacterized protein
VEQNLKDFKMFTYFLFVLPPMLIAMWAQWRVQHSFAVASRQPSRMSGAATARLLLDEAGLQNVPIEKTEGFLSDHYDAHRNILRLSAPVFHGQTLAAAGIAAHEAGHAIQDAKQYLPLVIRNAAVPVAAFGSNTAFLFLVLGGVFASMPLIWLGIILFALAVVFQIVNLPVEFDASARAKRLLVERGIVSVHDMPYVNSVLNAAAMTYVAATLQGVMTLLYFLSIFSGRDRE